MPDTFSATIYGTNLKGTHQAFFRRDLVMMVEERTQTAYSPRGERLGEEPSGCFIHLITGKGYWSTDSCAEVIAKWQGIVMLSQCPNIHTRGGRCQHRAGHSGLCMTREQDGTTPAFFTPPPAAAPLPPTQATPGPTPALEHPTTDKRGPAWSGQSPEYPFQPMDGSDTPPAPPAPPAPPTT